MGLLYYLFSVHHWGLSDLKALWEGETGWHDLIFALSSYEVEQRVKDLSLESNPKKFGKKSRHQL